MKSKPEDQERINGELRRIVFLRRVLENETDAAVSGLVGNLEGSMAAWRKCRGGHGIDAVLQWRSRRNLPNDVDQDFPREETSKPYNPDSDVKAYHISYKDGEHVENSQGHGVRGHSHKHKMLEPLRKIPISRLLM